MGSIELILGPMFSGKTTEMVRRLRRQHHANKRVVIIKYDKDQRYDEKMCVTHDGVQSGLPTINVSSLLPLINCLEYDVMGVDEGQFFPDAVEFCESLANQGKLVIVSALDATYQRKPFGRVLELIPLAESVIKLYAICPVCFKEASFTQRIGKDDQREIVIGGAEMYRPLCRSCFMKSLF